MFEILERCIDLCFVSHTVLNFVIGQEMGDKNVSTVWKVSIINNWITQPAKLEYFDFTENVFFVLSSKEPIFAENASFFILNNHATWNFWWRYFWIIFTTGKLLVLALTVFLPKRVILFTLLLKLNVLISLGTQSLCCMNTSTSKLEHAFW